MMNRIFLSLAIVTLVATAVLGGSAFDIERISTHSAAPLPIINERALVIDYGAGERCALFDGDGNLVFGDGGIKVITFSANGNMMTRCQASDLANSTGSAVVYNGDDNPFGPGTKCGILSPSGLCLTDTWTNTISASGHGHVVCVFRNASCQ